MTADLLHALRERVKELTSLHATARILQDGTKPVAEVMRTLAALLPSAWQYPEITAARIRYQDLQAVSPGFAESPWRQAAAFATSDGRAGAIEIFYLEARPPADDGPFLKEERDLIDSLAEMLSSYFQHKLASDALQKANDELELQVRVRTAQLQQLAAELCLAEARERRAIAEDLHDHIGQALAIIKMGLAELRGNAIFCGFEDRIGEMNRLLEQTIRYSRNLTFDLSPPSLYELGVAAAVGGLVERFGSKHGIAVTFAAEGDIGRVDTKVEVFLFKSIEELLMNVAKHAGARRVEVSLRRAADGIRAEVRDDGCGFDPHLPAEDGERDAKFGLFSIQERFNLLGGSVAVRSAPGRGTAVLLHAPAVSREGQAC
jgi:signal transduction histidine kinase